MAVLEAPTDDECYLFAILQDASGLDLAEFTWFDQEREDGCWRAWAFQWSWFRCVSPLQIDQCARALAIDTPIPTPKGWTTMGVLAPGDQVYDSEGLPTTVLAVSPVWTDRRCFEVCFDDHTSIVADGDHLWLTWDKKARAARAPRRRGIAQPFVRSTTEIAASLMSRSEHNHAIDVTAPLQGAESSLPLDPYYVGYWLGDGSSNTSEITTADTWVLSELSRRDFDIVDRRAPLLYGVKFRHPHKRKTESVQAILRGLGILHNKHIPGSYLRASEKQRRDLLAGLVDSDGHMQSNGSCEVTQKREVVARGLIELLRSLGEKPRITKKTAFCNGVDCGPVYRVTWRPRVNPALMPRKAEAFVPPALRALALGQRRIIAVREVPTRPVRCITVASPSSLFLAGDGMIPTHNSVGKSLSIKLRAFIFPFIHPGQEMVITAPEKVHLDAITDIIETQLTYTRLTSEMLTGGRASIKHQPFHVNFVNGSRIMGRIPHRDGAGVKGIHPIWLEADEMQDYPKPGWDELIETLKRGFEGAVWRAHGVTRGVRDEFFKHSQPESDWLVHRYTAMSRPNWTNEERLEKINLYGGSKDHPTYRRNVLGLHGDLTNPLFVLHRLMKCVDQDEASDYNQSEYTYLRLSDETVADYGDIVGMLDFPPAHKDGKYLYHWIGMDVGFTVDPSEILVFGEYKPRRKPNSEEEPKSVLRLLTRVHLERIRHEQQVRAILWMVDYYRPKVFAMDKTGLGLPLFQDVQDKAPLAAELIHGYNFSEKILVDFDDTIVVDEFTGDLVKEAGIKRNVREYAQDCLRDLVDAERVQFPWDRELIAQFQGGTQTTRPMQDQYGRRKVFSAGDDHALDAARMAALGFKQYHIEEMLKNQQPEPVFDVFITY